jgi:hypothetical protein
MSVRLTFGAFMLAAASFAAEPARSERSLDGPWEFRPVGDKPTPWKAVTVPSSMQSHEGMEWHGIGTYRKKVGKLNLAAGKRALIHFTAVSTHAEVFWNDEKVGEHLGGWTPFRFDVTDAIRKAGPDADHVLIIKVDEKVGHNTQGFLPIVQPHFGGIWQSVKLLTVHDKYVDDLTAIAPKDVDLPTWSPPDPKLKEVLVTNESGDRITIRTAKRTIETKGDQLLLNGKPLQVRGVLNWGYYPPTLEPNPSEQTWRADLKRIKARGFNLMKCCLWVPPARLLDIADEEGVLIWMEYPTWHPQLTPKHLVELTSEFVEFFAHVRNHPCVVLHSLTCETGPSADINVLKALTAKCKEMISGAVVEDDSSWIEWNRVTDFYDDHPYGNNHTWVKTLHRLREHKTLGVKPLLLGEAIAADTWTVSSELLRDVGSERPYWLPHHFQANAHWLHRMADGGAKVLERQLAVDSKKYAMLMRKFQMETFRREVPNGGYVVSVMRDFPLAAMGLIDYQGYDKWPAGAWTWHGETMLLLETESDRRTFTSGTSLKGRLTTAGPTLAEAKRTFVSGGKGAEKTRDDVEQDFDIKLATVANPERVYVSGMIDVAGKTITSNHWPMWVVPAPAKIPDSVIVARKLDESLLAKLEAGARVLLIPDNSPGSPPLQSHWFLRGGPVVFNHPAIAKVPNDLLVETQPFDLAGDVIPNVNYLDQIDPIMLLWDNHDIREVRTHALAFSTQVGKGRLLVSALRHDGDTNSAGKWLQSEFARYLAVGSAPRRSLSKATIDGIREKLTEQKLELGGKTVWKFRPDPKNNGLEQKWHEPDTKIADWGDIRINAHWEGQGHANLDGWAWYRLTVNVPKEFAGKDVYLRFTGVDDHYEAYVNGKKAGSGGDIATKTTAFEEVKAHKITDFVKPGESATIAIRVYDWYGAGGIFRPVTLTTAADSVGSTFVK